MRIYHLRSASATAGKESGSFLCVNHQDLMSFLRLSLLLCRDRLFFRCWWNCYAASCLWIWGMLEVILAHLFEFSPPFVHFWTYTNRVLSLPWRTSSPLSSTWSTEQSHSYRFRPQWRQDICNSRQLGTRRVLDDKKVTRKVDSNNLSGRNPSDPQHFLDDFNLVEQLADKFCVMIGKRVGRVKQMQLLFLCDRSAQEGQIVI